MNWSPTPQQKAAIDNRGALLVSAAAGSGKTAVLVERVVQCLLDPAHPTDINRILVVTFTKAAAAEMRERIRARLAEESQKDPGNIRLLRQQMLLDKANISTIDSFCKTLITDHFEALDLSPDFTLITPNALALLEAAAMEETLNAFFEGQPETFGTLAKLLGAEQDTAPMARAIQKIYAYLRSLPFPARWIGQVRQQYHAFTAMEESLWGQALLARGKEIAAHALRVYEDALEVIQADPLVLAKRGPALQAAREQMQVLLHTLENEPWDAVKTACDAVGKIKWGTSLPATHASPAKDRTAAAQGQSEAAAKQLHGLFAFDQAACRAQCEALTGPMDLLLDAVEDYARRVAAKKAEANSLDFADLEYAALALLVADQNGVSVDTPHTQSICQRYDYVLVDEFQDVNDLQSEILNAISHHGRRLFSVGDMKQSIYRFRQANPRNFLRLLQEYPDYDGRQSPGKVTLDGNFRSRPAVCGAVNGLFALVMSRLVGELDYDASHRLNAMGRFAPAALPPVQLDFLTADDARSPQELEADRIAQHIKEAMRVACVSEGDTLRPARPGDCVVLLRGVKGYGETYVRRLRAHGIPAVSEQDSSLLAQPEVAKTVALLRVIDNPADDVSLLACMMSPVFGFTADDVASIRGRDTRIPLYVSAERAAQAGNQPAAALMQTLQDLRAYAATVTPDRLLLRLYDRYGYLSAVQAMENGGQRKANLLALMEAARDCTQNGYDRLDGFLRYLRKIESGELSLSISCATEEPDAVRIMTIHHAKGLQFPLCFVAGCSRKYNEQDLTAPLLMDQRLGLGLTMTDDVLRTRTKTCMRAAIAEENRRASRSEELRVLYVAMTRGVDRLVMLATDADWDKKINAACAALQTGLIAAPAPRLDPTLALTCCRYSDLLLYFALLHPAGESLRPADAPIPCSFAPETGDLLIRRPVGEEIPLPTPRTPPAAPPAHRADEAMLAEIRQRLSFQNPYAPLANLFSKRSVSQLVHDLPDRDAGLTTRPSFLQQDGLSAAEKGTALHAFMQYADYPAAAADPGQELDRLVRQAFLTAPQAACVDRHKLARFFAGPLYARMAASPRVLREHRFMSAVPVTRLDPDLPAEFAGETVVVQGIADCVFEEDGGLVVVDYKTDRVTNADALRDRYAKQLLLYAEMLRETTGKPVKELLIYSFALDAVVPVPYTG